MARTFSSTAATPFADPAARVGLLISSDASRSFTATGVHVYVAFLEQLDEEL